MQNKLMFAMGVFATLLPSCLGSSNEALVFVKNEPAPELRVATTPTQPSVINVQVADVWRIPAFPPATLDVTYGLAYPTGDKSVEALFTRHCTDTLEPLVELVDGGTDEVIASLAACDENTFGSAGSVSIVFDGAAWFGASATGIGSVHDEH